MSPQIGDLDDFDQLAWLDARSAKSLVNRANFGDLRAALFSAHIATVSRFLSVLEPIRRRNLLTAMAEPPAISKIDVFESQQRILSLADYMETEGQLSRLPPAEGDANLLPWHDIFLGDDLDPVFMSIQLAGILSAAQGAVDGNDDQMRTALQRIIRWCQLAETSKCE